VDRNGAPVAWYTYAALSFLEPRLRADLEVFEYGSGHSTLWWAERVAHVCSVESEIGWVEHLRPQLPANTELRHESPGSPYVRSPLDRGRRFDVIVIDGFDRNECARVCPDVLTDDGVIVWDNADREREYADGFDHLRARGFARLDFDGLGPLNGYGWRTTVFYRRAANWLGI